MTGGILVAWLNMGLIVPEIGACVCIVTDTMATSSQGLFRLSCGAGKKRNGWNDWPEV